MKYIFAAFLFTSLAHAITAPETISSEAETEAEMEVGAPKDCVVLGKTNDQSENADKLAIQKQVMDCLGPEVEVAPVEIQKKSKVVVQ